MEKPEVYYWTCCDIYQECHSLHEARMNLEQHEKDCHKGKPIGAFGIKRK